MTVVKNINCVDIDAARPLAELTAAVNAVCDGLEGRGEKAAVVLRLTTLPSGTVQWPGEIGVSAVNRWERAVRRLEKLDVVTIAVAEGTCAGPALDLLLAVDFRVGAPDLVVTLPVNDGHFWPGMALFRLVQLLGVRRARQLVMWGGNVTLPRAVELGLVDHGGEDIEEAVRAATALTGHLADRETALRRQLITEAATADYDEALGIHLAACDRELRRLRSAAADVPEFAGQAAS
ncbi:enoyl-CoA-hydratase DpgB [Streptomyces sp. NPDC059447]|uniref:enoyl-CoA-hydratase DpgB n=1 Tax=unclassified Streptomyces TaxID=2593676 RepID=UPI0036B6E992